MTNDDIVKMFMGAYYGTLELDEYPLKEYVATSIMKYVESFIEENQVNDFEHIKEMAKCEDLIRQYQDCLLVYLKLNVSWELKFLVKKKIRELKEEGMS